MLERRYLGDIPRKPHTVFKRHGVVGSEFVFTRDGFSGGFSILYNEEAPTTIASITPYEGELARFLGELVPHSELTLARRHVKSGEAEAGKDFMQCRTTLYKSEHCRISVLRGRTSAGDYAFCNGDGDELYFAYAGHGVLHTMFGSLSFGTHDYLLIPRGVAYHLESDVDLDMLVVEGSPFIEIPAEFRNPFGQLKLEAPYTHRDFASPDQLLTAKEWERFKNLLTLRNGCVTMHRYPRSPVRTTGWDGSVYPLRFNIHDYLPKTGKIHLPPNLHLTFKARDFVVCSFVPRMVDYHPDAIPCPYPHANVACDEILYYVSGNFTSRRGVEGRSISHHPAGVPHGPQPGNYLKSVGSHSTDEVAVMIDTWEPLQHTRAALRLEDPSYQMSWND